MPRKRASQLRCPTCKQRITAGNAEFPFCSERCRLIDLGRWASDEYRIAVPAQENLDAPSPSGGEDED